MKNNQLLALASFGIFSLLSSPVQALTYNASSNWTGTFNGGGLPASLTGTVDIPVGIYNFSGDTTVAAPSTAFNLTLTVNGTAFPISSSTIQTGDFSSCRINVM